MHKLQVELSSVAQVLNKRLIFYFYHPGSHEPKNVSLFSSAVWEEIYMSAIIFIKISPPPLSPIFQPFYRKPMDLFNNEKGFEIVHYLCKCIFSNYFSFKNTKKKSKSFKKRLHFFYILMTQKCYLL